MIVYLDTSALVKKYFKENYSTEIIDLWKTSSAIFVSNIAYAESIASFYRKNRESKIDKKHFAKIILDFKKDWETFICFYINDSINLLIEKLVKKYFLRGFDVIHLASALSAREALKNSEEYIFACFDKGLLKAAIKEGLKTFPEQI